MVRHDLGEAAWAKSSYSGSGGSDCVEWQRLTDGTVAVRDSKTPALGAYVFTPTAWAAFVDAARTGTFSR
ncbi:DUF397 domain-containing protein [Streptomyces sp. NBC_01262]|uniref:DUF397 domain-containing protein n=1 Tax=Streptomyces sp. NBC_01262 TaxID=2903803 RepID=UPI002E360361|nr:DUF397 domain-containing protein [Streptomyces sp. NBC_01262]